MNDYHILALDTSGEVCSVALLSRQQAQCHVQSERQAGQRHHARHVLALATRLLQQQSLSPADLSAVAYGQGPGSFTGLRLACGVAQGLALSLGVPVLPVDSLLAAAVQAAGAQPQGVFLVLQDARMGEIYAAAYRAGPAGWLRIQDPVLLAAEEVANWAGSQSAAWLAQGSAGWTVVLDAALGASSLVPALQALGADIHVLDPAPGAGDLVRLAERDWQQGQGQDPAQASPAYVRNKVAYTTAERAQGLGGNPQVRDDTVQVLPMKPTDVDEVLAIEQRVQLAPWTRGNFADALAAGHHGWVVRRMGALLGFALLMQAPDMAHVLDIGVRPDVQRQGLGSRLLQACMAHARRAGLPAVTLEVRQGNQAAIDFYEHHGFVRRGVRRGYYPTPQGREDAWIMTLDLPDAAA